jgi:hypothetical protein
VEMTIKLAKIEIPNVKPEKVPRKTPKTNKQLVAFSCII